VVSGDGEHHDATPATWDFCCRDDRTRGLRLHPHAETDKAAVITPQPPSGQAAHQGRGAADCGEYSETAGVVRSEGLALRDRLRLPPPAPAEQT
jgi:hypothetical protein